MNDLENHIARWIRSGRNDLVTASLLIDEARPVEGVFFCYLAIEKVLKARIIRYTKDDPPGLEDLKPLLKLASVKISQEDLELLEVLTNSRHAIRYPRPETDPDAPSTDHSQEYLERSKELFSWLEMTI